MSTVIYDPQCDVCTRLRQRLALVVRDTRLAWLSCHAEDLQARHPAVPLPDGRERLHLVDDDGRVHAGSEAIRRILKVTGLGGMMDALGAMGAGLLVDQALHAAGTHAHGSEVDLPSAIPPAWLSRVDEMKQRFFGSSEP